nr:glycosyltransferase [Adlercreutzia sp. ZJ305]
MRNLSQGNRLIDSGELSSVKYVQLTARSTGWAESVVFSKHCELRSKGNDSWVFWGRGAHEQDEFMQRICNPLNTYLDAVLTRIDDRAGFHSRMPTRRLLKRLDAIDPDIVHLHILHGYWINIEMLFGWLASHRCRVIWTQHDCWAFTGHCANFIYANCAQWQSHCAYSEKCPQLNAYPKTLFQGNCVQNYADKKRIFTSIPASRLTLVSPSKWLAEIISESFFDDYPIEIIPNHIDETVFRPVQSNWRKRLGIGNRFMVLGVANPWTERKGFGDFLEVSRIIGSDVAIVLVGLNKKQLEGLPEGVIGIERTADQRELAELYSDADLFCILSYEENYPTVALEARACGAQIIAYDAGGTSEAVGPEAEIVGVGDVTAVCESIMRRKRENREEHH